VRTAARGALKGGVLPALGANGLAPFARRLVLHIGAALTHVAPPVRRDAPAVLEALLDAAPALVAAHAPAATLRHIAELLRRGDDAASSSLVSGGSGFGNDKGEGGAGFDPTVNGGLSAKFGNMTASRVGAQTPSARLQLLVGPFPTLTPPDP
jgi:pre-rRNA-processing protein IPI1